MCFSFLFPSLPPHTLAAATKTPNAKSTLQAGWHKHSTILAQASFCRGILSETLWHIQASLLSSWGPCLPQSRQQQGALTTNVLSISLCLHQTKQQHFVSVHWSPPQPKKICQSFIVSLHQPATEKYCCCGKRECKSLHNEQEQKKRHHSGEWSQCTHLQLASQNIDG